MGNRLLLFIVMASATLSAASPASPASVAPAAITKTRLHPTASEMEGLLRRDWDYYAAFIRRKEGLAATPASLLRVSEVLCHSNLSGTTFECAAIVHFTLSTGRPSSALMVETLGRNEQGRLVQLIIIRELPVSK